MTFPFPRAVAPTLSEQRQREVGTSVLRPSLRSTSDVDGHLPSDLLGAKETTSRLIPRAARPAQDKNE